MKVSLACVCAILVATLSATRADDFNWTRPYYEITVGVNGGSDFTLGRGIDMRNPLQPVVAPVTPYDPDTLKTETSKPLVEQASAAPQALQNFGFSYIESTDEQEEARYLYAYFKIAYGLANFNAATTRSKNERTSSQSIYLISNKEGDTKILKGGPDWTSAPTSEDILDPKERAAQYATMYGSHFVSAITYGYTIVIRATINSKSATELNSLTAHLKASLGLLSAGGALTTEQRNYFSQSSVNITGSVISGGTSPARNLVLTSFADVAAFLGDLKAGKFVINDAPVRARLTNWWVFLTPFPKTRAVFSANISTPVPAPFGVPRGTVIAWVPPGEMMDISNPKEPRVRFPEGWRLCDGEQQTPDIGQNFLYGTNSLSQLRETGGSLDHTHRINIGPSDSSQENIKKGDNKDAAGKGHSHPASASKESNLPPYFKVLWICRL